MKETIKKIAINGFGKLGMHIFQYILESEAYKNGEVDVVAINEIVADIPSIVYSLKHDSTKYNLIDRGHTIEFKEFTDFVDWRVEPVKVVNIGGIDFKFYPKANPVGALLIDGKEIKVYAEPFIDHLPWGTLGIDTVYECSNVSVDEAQHHLHTRDGGAGAKHLIYGCPVAAIPMTLTMMTI